MAEKKECVYVCERESAVESPPPVTAVYLSSVWQSAAMDDWAPPLILSALLTSSGTF